jgi:hypothetical protein
MQPKSAGPSPTTLEYTFYTPFYESYCTVLVYMSITITLLYHPFTLELHFF